MKPLDFPKLSRVFREALLGYDLRPNEFLLGQVVCLETYDAGRVSAPVRLAIWAEWLDLRDAKSLRPDKCAALLQTLNSLGIVAVNPAQGMFEPRPDANLWSRARAYRARAFSGDSAELPLQSEPLLAEALSEVARENALRQGATPPGPPSAKSAAVGEILRSSEKSAERSATAGQSAVSFAPAGLLAATDGVARARERLTFNRFNVETNKRSTLGAAEKSAGAQLTSKQVWQQVRAFVGETDFREHWERAGYLWSNPERVQILAGALAYVAAGVKSGEMMIKTTPGAALWSQAQIDWRKAEAARM